MGGAILAAKSLGMFNSIDGAAMHFIRYKDAVLPNDTVREHYTQKYAQYKQFRNFSLSQNSDL